MNEFLHDEDVAALLKISVQGLRNKLEAGDPLPPRAQPPGMRVRLWPRKEVEEWIRQFVRLGSSVDAQVVQTEPARGRGRPPKLARRMA